MGIEDEGVMIMNDIYMLLHLMGNYEYRIVLFEILPEVFYDEKAV